jgi:hypothetical protein
LSITLAWSADVWKQWWLRTLLADPNEAIEPRWISSATESETNGNEAFVRVCWVKQASLWNIRLTILICKSEIMPILGHDTGKPKNAKSRHSMMNNI